MLNHSIKVLIKVKKGPKHRRDGSLNTEGTVLFVHENHAQREPSLLCFSMFV